MERLITVVPLELAMIALCFWKPRAGRIVFGFFFLAMALGVNVPLTLTNVDSYGVYGSNAFFGLYRWAFREIVALNPMFWAVLLIVYETSVGLLMLSRNRSVQLGVIGGILFVLVITPLGIETLGNPLLAVAMGLLLRQRYDQSVVEMLRGWRLAHAH